MAPTNRVGRREEWAAPWRLGILSSSGGGGAPNTATITEATAAVLAALFGVRRLRAAYTGPVLQLQRKADGVVADFADPAHNGALFTNDANATPVAAWLGGSTAGVTIWYDQSRDANGAHAKGPVTTYGLPQYDCSATTQATAPAYLPALQFDMSPLQIANGAVPYGNGAYTMIVHQGTPDTLPGQWTVFSLGNNSSSYRLNYLGIFNDGSILQTWWGGTNLTVSGGCSGRGYVLLNGYSGGVRTIMVNGVRVANISGDGSRNQVNGPNYIGMFANTHFYTGRVYAMAYSTVDLTNDANAAPRADLTAALSGK